MSTEKPDVLSDDLGNSSLQRQKFGWPQKKFTKIQITSEKVHKSLDDLRNSSPHSLYDLGISVFGILFLVRKFRVFLTPLTGVFWNGPIFFVWNLYYQVLVHQTTVQLKALAVLTLWKLTAFFLKTLHRKHRKAFPVQKTAPKNKHQNFLVYS